MVLKSEDLEDVDISALKLVVCRETLGVKSELEVYDALWRWSARECKRQRVELTPANRRAALEGAQFLVRYLTLTSEELGRASGLLSAEEAEALSAMVAGEGREEGFEMPDHLAEMQAVMRTPRVGRKERRKQRLSRAGSAIKLAALGATGKRRPSVAVIARQQREEEEREHDRKMAAVAAAAASAERDRRQVDELKERTRRKFNLVEEFFVCLACIFD